MMTFPVWDCIEKPMLAGHCEIFWDDQCTETRERIETHPTTTTSARHSGYLFITVYLIFIIMFMSHFTLKSKENYSMVCIKKMKTFSIETFAWPTVLCSDASLYGLFLWFSIFSFMKHEQNSYQIKYKSWIKQFLSKL